MANVNSINTSLKNLTIPDKPEPPALDQIELKRVKLDVSAQKLSVGRATFNILGNIEEEEPSVRSYTHAEESSVTDSDAVFMTMVHDEEKTKGRFPNLSNPARGNLDLNINKIKRAHGRNVETSIGQKLNSSVTKLCKNRSRHKLDKFLTKDQSFE